MRTQLQSKVDGALPVAETIPVCEFGNHTVGFDDLYLVLVLDVVIDVNACVFL